MPDLAQYGSLAKDLILNSGMLEAVEKTGQAVVLVLGLATDNDVSTYTDTATDTDTATSNDTKINTDTDTDPDTDTEADEEGENVAFEIAKNVASTFAATAVTGVVTSMLGVGLFGIFAANLADRYASGALGKATGNMWGDNGGRQGSAKVKGPGGFPSKKHGHPSGRGRSNNPPKKRRSY